MSDTRTGDAIPKESLTSPSPESSSPRSIVAPKQPYKKHEISPKEGLPWVAIAEVKPEGS